MQVCFLVGFVWAVGNFCGVRHPKWFEKISKITRVGGPAGYGDPQSLTTAPGYTLVDLFLGLGYALRSVCAKQGDCVSLGGALGDKGLFVHVVIIDGGGILYIGTNPRINPSRRG